MEPTDMFFRHKKIHEEAIQDSKRYIDGQFSKARQSIARNRRELINNGITLEIKKALGGKHV